MTITSNTVEPGIVARHRPTFPPVNAHPVARLVRTRRCADRAAATTRTPTRVILRAEGRGFNAGVDIKEMQRTEGFSALIDANRGCFAAFRAVYECAGAG